MKDGVESNTTGKIQYVFRRPKFPIICAVGNELLSATSPAVFQRQLERLDLQGAKVIDIVDATGEGWAFHADLMDRVATDPQEALEEGRSHPAFQRE